MEATTAHHGRGRNTARVTGVEKASKEKVEMVINVKQVDYQQACLSTLLSKQDFITFYVNELAQVVDMEAIAKAGVKIGVDPLGGSGIHYWPVIAKKYGLNLEIVNPVVDPSHLRS